MGNVYGDGRLVYCSFGRDRPAITPTEYERSGKPVWAGWPTVRPPDTER
ncbi:hypothetical protein ACLI4Z_11035 [Natrialbaceae archaeon A-arb3/5]